MKTKTLTLYKFTGIVKDERKIEEKDISNDFTGIVKYENNSLEEVTCWKSKLFYGLCRDLILTLRSDAIYSAIIEIQRSECFCHGFDQWLWKLYQCECFSKKKKIEIPIPLSSRANVDDGKMTVVLVPGGDARVSSIQKEILSWSIVNPLIIGRIQNEYISAYLSTLGGAHSSLGDSLEEHSHKAGVISKKQYVLAIKMNDPVLRLRCQLFYAHSLLQQGDLKPAAKIIRSVYKFTQNCHYDNSLVVTCCKAEWSKYVYLKSLRNTDHIIGT